MEDDIKFLEGLKRYNPPLPNNFNEKIDGVIKRLRIGKQYRIMWNDYKGRNDHDWQIKEFSEFEQKYFPKRIKNIIEVAVEASNYEVIDEVAREIEDMINSQSHRKGKIGVTFTRWVRD